MIAFVDLQDEISQWTEERASLPPPRNTLRDLKYLSRAEELSGLKFDLIDDATGQFSSGLTRTLDPTAATAVRDGLQRATSVVIVDHHPDLTLYGLRVPATDYLAGGVILKGEVPVLREKALKSGCSELTWENWFRQHSGIRPLFARRLLAMTYLCMTQELMQNDLLTNNESLVHQLTSSYETMTLIGDLTRQFSASTPPYRLADTIIRRVQQISEADWSAFCLRHDGSTWWQLHGEWEMTEDELQALIAQFQGRNEPQVIVRNQASSPELRRKFPRLRSLVAVPVFVTEQAPSWLILANPINRPEMGTEEVHLLKAVGYLLVTQVMMATQCR